MSSVVGYLSKEQTSRQESSNLKGSITSSDKRAVQVVTMQNEVGIEKKN